MLGRMISAYCLLLTLLTQPAHAQGNVPTPPPGELLCSKLTKLAPDNPLQERLAGTVRMRGCSGSLVTFEGRGASQKALVLTAGHCIAEGSLQYGTRPGYFLAPGQVLKSLSQAATFTIHTPRPDRRKACIGVSALLYATLTDIDIALYELTETYGELKQRTGVVPFLVSRDPVAPVGEMRGPSGFHEDEGICTLGGNVQHAKEFVWSWGPLMWLKGCTFTGGHSGLPLISVATGQVVGVLSSSNDGYGEPCERNVCEVDAAGTVTVRPVGTQYAHYTHRLAACMTASGSLELTLPTCTLPR